MSADGTVIVGYATDSELRSFRWTRSTGIFWLPAVNGYATAVSGDGKTIVGSDGFGGTFVYTDEGGYVHLDTGALDAKATTVSYDGSVIAGRSLDGSVEGQWVWDRSNGLRMLADLLRARGADTGTLYLESVSADGKVFTGEGYDGDNQVRAWIARL
jgi:uncharacterized membrane protein